MQAAEETIEKPKGESKQDSEEESGEENSQNNVIKEARMMLRNSKLVKNLANHICGEEDAEAQCFLRDMEWRTIAQGCTPNKTDDDIHTTKADYDPRDFKNACYRLKLASCGPMTNTIEELFPNPTLFPNKECVPDMLVVIVKLFADQAQIKVEFSMSSRDVGYEESPVLSCMVAAFTGKWLESHNVFPSVEQFEAGLRYCLKLLRMEEWADGEDEEDGEGDSEGDSSEEESGAEKHGSDAEKQESDVEKQGTPEKTETKKAKTIAAKPEQTVGDAKRRKL